MLHPSYRCRRHHCRCPSHRPAVRAVARRRIRTNNPTVRASATLPRMLLSQVVLPGVRMNQFQWCSHRPAILPRQGHGSGPVQHTPHSMLLCGGCALRIPQSLARVPCAPWRNLGFLQLDDKKVAAVAVLHELRIGQEARLDVSSVRNVRWSTTGGYLPEQAHSTADCPLSRGSIAWH